MKKFLALILSLFSAIFVLTGCSNKSLILNGRYYQGNLAGDEALKETSVYTVTVVNKTPSNSTEVKNDNVTMVINEGTYVTTLTSASLLSENLNKYRNGYLYETNLSISGKYVINGVDHPFNDEYKTYTYLKSYHENLQPYETTKTVKSSTLLASNEYFVDTIEYSYVIKYEDKANVDFTVIKDDKNRLSGLDGSVSYSNYNDSAFIDNELILFLPRTFNLENNYLQNFQTIDVLSKKIQKLAYTNTIIEDKPDVKTFTLPAYTLNNGAPEDKTVTATHLTVELTGTYKGAEIEAYYANDQKDMRRNLVKLYTAVNSSLGYLEYTLKSVTRNT